MSVPAEVWLRGPLPGIVPLLQPAAHALVQISEDVLPIIGELLSDQLWARPGGGAAIGFHLAHLPASTDRLLTYARGEGLSEHQLAVLAAERRLYDDRPDLAELTERFARGMAAAVDTLRTFAADDLLQPRAVGRKRLPSTTLGLIFHAAEHGSRHAGQIVTLVPIVRAMKPAA